MLIGIDLGTTALKVAAFDPKTGKMLHGVEKRLPLELDSDGWREQAPDAVIRALRIAIGQLGKALGGLKKVTGMALAAQGGSTIIVDRETGDAHTPMILWNDARASSEFQELAESKSARYWRTRTLRDEPGMGLARIAWLREHAPEFLDDYNLYVGAGEYVYHHLTGLWRQDTCNAMQIGCYDARTQSLSKELAALADISTDFVAPLRQGHEFHPLSSVGAKSFGLPEGIPVAGPYMDHEAGFLAASHVSERPLQCSLGTAWVGNFCLPEGIQGEAPFQFAIPSPKGSEPLIIMPLLTGNVTWDWALSTLLDRSTEEALKKQQVVFKSAVLPPEGLVALPWLNRPNALHPDLLGGACFLGMGSSTTRDDLVRATVAGMCYELVRVFSEVASMGTIDSVVLSGGASKGIQFQQLIAHLFGDLPVYQIEDESWMGTRGALHAFGTRVTKAKVRRIRPGRSVDSDALARGYACYLDAFERLYSDVTAGRAYAVKGTAT